MAKKVKSNILEDKGLNFPNLSSKLQEILLEFDSLYDMEWLLIHLRTTDRHLNYKGENKAATGGSKWKKYLHPKSTA